MASCLSAVVNRHSRCSYFSCARFLIFVWIYYIYTGVVVISRFVAEVNAVSVGLFVHTGPNTNKRFTKMLEIVKPVPSTRKKGRGILN